MGSLVRDWKISVFPTLARPRLRGFGKGRDERVRVVSVEGNKIVFSLRDKNQIGLLRVVSSLSTAPSSPPLTLVDTPCRLAVNARRERRRFCSGSGTYIWSVCLCTGRVNTSF